jgi:hypothetical protein
LLDAALQIPIGVGSTQKAWEEVSVAVAGPYEQLQAALPTQPVLNADETGHRTNRAKRWLWTVVAPTFVFYTITASRGSDVLQRLPGATFAGTLGSDRLRTYTTYGASQRQYCWPHLTRNLLSAKELARTTDGQGFCRQALTPAATLVPPLASLPRRSSGAGWPPYPRTIDSRVYPVERAFFALAERPLDFTDIDANNLARALFEQHQHFFHVCA